MVEEVEVGKREGEKKILSLFDEPFDGLSI